MAVCEMCGNDMVVGSRVCRYCGYASNHGDTSRKTGPKHRVVNLEQGKPTVAQALLRLDLELQRARAEKTPVLIVIHGYGSSGKGGAIRKECRKTLDFLKGSGKIYGYITGERFAKKHGATRELLRRFPELCHDHNLNRGNQGVTLIVVF